VPRLAPFIVVLRERGLTDIHDRRPQSECGLDQFSDPKITFLKYVPLVSLDCWVYLDRHLFDEALPSLLDEVHDGVGLVGRGERDEDGDAVAKREPPKVHPGGADVADEVAAAGGHEVEEPDRDGLRVDVELVDGRVRVLLRLEPVDVGFQHQQRTAQRREKERLDLDRVPVHAL
jgi:hypothetical protein